MKRILYVGGLIAAMCVPAFAGNTVIVHIFNFDFSINPQGGAIEDVVINVGDTVRWLWDQGTHSTKSVAGIPEVWESQVTNVVGTTFDHTFTNVGEWQYFCTIHGFDNGNQTAGGMSGTVTVVPEPASFLGLGTGLMIFVIGRRRKQGRV